MTEPEQQALRLLADIELRAELIEKLLHEHQFQIKRLKDRIDHFDYDHGVVRLRFFALNAALSALVVGLVALAQVVWP